MRMSSIRHRRGLNFEKKVAGILVSMWIIASAMPAPSSGKEADGLYSFGSGPVEVLIFSDYFCPPCQGIEDYLESVLPSLTRLGAKITFVDLPIYAKTPLYSRYFLYAAKASETFDEVLRARNLLFDLAKAKGDDSNKEMIRLFQEKKIALSFFDIRPVFDKWRESIDLHQVKSTPTCVVIKPGEDALKYSGGLQIREGIESLLKELSDSSNKKGMIK
jgi:protein-disulfide isomerase